MQLLHGLITTKELIFIFELPRIDCSTLLKEDPVEVFVRSDFCSKFAIAFQEKINLRKKKWIWKK